MKPTKHILITIAMLLCSITANAHHFEVDGIYYFGYIMSIKTIDEQTLLLRVEAKLTEALYYALRQTFPELQVVYKTISYLDKN